MHSPILYLLGIIASFISFSHLVNAEGGKKILDYYLIFWEKIC